MSNNLEINSQNRPITIFGAGTLGRRIALMFSTRGGEVRIYDKNSDALAAAKSFVEESLPEVVKTVPNGKAATLKTFTDFDQAIDRAWLVVESLPEIPDLKIEVLGQLDRAVADDTIIATNSSSYRSSELAAKVEHKNRLLNMHFMMPPMARAVELMTCGETDRAIIDFLSHKLADYGLSPYVAEKESMGFIYNRIWAAIKRESLYVVAQGVASPQTVDRIFVETLGTKQGPFRSMDMVGLDVVLDIEEHYAKERRGIPEEPRELLRKMIAEGKLGVKSGEGFYNDYKKQ
ncbi:MAG: 3-hydroxyacyl-CoA dehydrogenase family protein [Sphingobacterium sp.]